MSAGNPLQDRAALITQLDLRAVHQHLLWQPLLTRSSPQPGMEWDVPVVLMSVHPHFTLQSPVVKS